MGLGWICAWGLLFGFGAGNEATSPALVLDASRATILIAPAIQRRDPAGDGEGWISSKELFFGQCTSGVELRIPLQAPRPGRWWWVSELRTPEELRLRLGARDLGVFGTSRAFRESPAGTFHTAIPLDLRGGPETLYVAASDPQGDVLLEVELVPDARLVDRIQGHTAYDAWILGVLTIILLVSIYLLWVARVRAYAWYVAYLAFGILWVGAKTGMAGALLWPDHPEWNHAVPSFASRVSLALYMLFLRDLVGLRDRFPRLGRVLDFGIAWVALCGLFALCSVALPDFHAGILRRFTPEIMEAPTLLLALGMLGWRARSDVLARRVLVACLPLVGAALYGQFRDFFKPIGVPDQDTIVVFIGAILEHIGTTLVLALDVRRRLDAHAGLVRDFDRRLDDQYRQYRARIGSDLHDDLSQRILAIRMSLHRQLKPAGGVPEEVEAQLQDLADSVRELSHQLHPSAHGTPSLQVALAELARVMGNPQLDFQLDLTYAKEHLPSVNLELFRIVQESISNAVHHGKATRIRIDTSAQGEGMLLSIQDNGTGLVAKSGGIGLAGIEARARRLGGTFRIAPLDEQGTVLEVWIPAER